MKEKQEPIIVPQYISPMKWNELSKRIAAENQNNIISKPYSIANMRKEFPVVYNDVDQRQSNQPLPPIPPLRRHGWHWSEIAMRRHMLRVNTPPHLLYFRREQKSRGGKKYGLKNRTVVKCRPIRVK